jgi:valyl-tRNA synthetase
VLETGYDIIFFWVARMILMTTYCVGEVPFKTVYLHGLVRDEQGRKMSKSLDNIIDPLDMIAKFGADATRLSLVIGSTPGNDSKLSEDKVAGYRNFTNKLWNIARFVLTTTNTTPNPSSLEEGNSESLPLGKGEVGGGQSPSLADRWILSRLDTVVASVTKKLEAYEFSAAGEELRDFTWNDFADWYLEIAKIQLPVPKARVAPVNPGSTRALGTGTEEVLLYVLETILAMWHPFMPFVTEVIWKEMGKDQLMIVAWPVAMGKRDEDAERAFAKVQEAIVSIRNMRAVQKIEPAKFVSIETGDTSLLHHADVVKRLARVEDIAVGDKPGIQLVLGSMDLEAERKRLTKERDELAKYIAMTDEKLANEEFTSKAPEKVVAQMKQKRDEAAAKLAAIQ